MIIKNIRTTAARQTSTFTDLKPVRMVMLNLFYFYLYI
jgi:hypothetical protein